MRSSVHLLILAVAAVSLGDAGAHAAEGVLEAQTGDVLIQSSRIDLKANATQVIKVDEPSATARPSLESALQSQPNIQVVPTPLRNTNVSLDGMSGEHVAISWDGDPVLGRLDGALDTRAVPLGNIERIAVYHGLDSLPYGSQNVAGVLSLESPWEAERRVQLRSSGGNFGQTILAGRASTQTRDGTSVFGNVSNWKGDAIPSRQSDDTLSDAYARFSASLMAAKPNVVSVAGRSFDARVGGDGFNQNSKGVFGGDPTDGDQRRVHVFSDLRSGTSSFHFSYSQYRNDYQGISQDRFEERAFRFGPLLQETTGNWTLFAGSMTDLHATTGTRLGSREVDQVRVGSHAGARYALGEHWVAGMGTRWDTGPGLVSPRAELRYLSQAGPFEQTTLVESGLGFREVTPKEQYMDFTNPAVRYRVVGNPDLRTERAWMTALRHTAKSRHFTLSASVFQMRVTDAIGYLPTGSADRGLAILSYANLGRTLTRGVQGGAEYHLNGLWTASANYQWLYGRNLGTQSELFLQPEHRVALAVGRNSVKGFSYLQQAVWSSRQAFFDANRNGIADDDWVGPYWLASTEVAYGFRWSGVSELLRVFARVDNALNVVREETFPTEPRTFLMGASVEL